MDEHTKNLYYNNTRILFEVAYKQQLTAPTILTAFNCLQCRKTFKSATGLKRHERIHFYFKCKKCDEVSSSQSDLYAHEVTVHGIKRPHKCKECDLAFIRLNNLKEHVRDVHEKLEPYICSICKYETQSLRNFERHMDSDEIKKVNIRQYFELVLIIVKQGISFW